MRAGRCAEPNIFDSHTVFTLTGPIYAARLDEFLLDIDSSLAKTKSVLKKDSGTTQTYPNPSYHLLQSGPSVSTVDDMERSKSLTPPTTPAIEIANLDIKSLPRSHIRALLVDDNKVNLSVLQFYCKKRKYPYTSAMDGNAAIAAFGKDINSQRHSLILMDMQMPECDGISATKAIRELEEIHGGPKSIIFMITGQDTAKDRRDSLEAGTDEFFVSYLLLDADN